METHTTPVKKLLEANEAIRCSDENILTKSDHLKICEIEVSIGLYTKKLKSLSGLGLKGQKKLVQKYIHSLVLKKERVKKQRVIDSIPELLTSKLSAKEREVWESFLPTNYTRKALGYYKYDIIPEDAIETFRECMDLGLFEQYEIRTPEMKETDPALFGRLGESWYLLARWSETKLLSFEDISERVGKAARIDSKGFYFSTAVLLFFICTGSFLGTWLGWEMLGTYPQWLKMFLSGIYGTAFGWIGFIFGMEAICKLESHITLITEKKKRKILYSE